MTAIEQRQGKSLYYTVKETIEAMIAQGDIPVGGLLPPELRLAERFNVSRGTVRQALDALESDRIITRRSGVGTTVLRKPPKAYRIISFTDQMKARGLVPSIRVLSVATIAPAQASEQVQQAFAAQLDTADASALLYQIKRLRLGNDAPLALHTVYLSVAQFGLDLLQTVDLSQSVFGLYIARGRWPMHANEIIQARAPSEDERALLQTDSQPFVYERERVTCDQNGVILEFAQTVERADVFGAYRYEIHALGPLT